MVTLYHGGLYHLYKYRRFQDVRLVFAPESAIAHFGGDPDNFMFPRYNLDVSFLRIYDDGAPAKTAHYLRWSPSGAKEGDLTFVSGHPGTTSRLFTVAELEYERDVAIPRRLLRLSEMRGMFTQFQERGPEQKRISMSSLLGVENSVKALRGRHEALLDRAFFASKVAAEQAFRARVEADPALEKSCEGAWDAIARAVEEQRKIQRRYDAVESRGAFGSTLMGFARTLVRLAEELPKPNEKRLREYADSKLPAVRQKLFSAAPIYDELEVLKLAFALTKLREDLGPDDPLVKKVLGKESPRDLAAALVRGTRLKDVAVRRQLFEGGKAAVEASDGSDDPAGPPHRPRRPRRPEEVRGRDRVGPEEERRADRQGRVRDLRHRRLSRRHLHAAPLLRPGEGVRAGREAGRAPHHARRDSSTGTPAGSRSFSRRPGSPPGDRWPWTPP